MVCSKCGGKSLVKDVTYNPDENEIYRFRRCTNCGFRFYTVEYEVIVNKRFEEDWAEFHRSKIHIKEENKND